MSEPQTDYAEKARNILDVVDDDKRLHIIISLLHRIDLLKEAEILTLEEEVKKGMIAWGRAERLEAKLKRIDEWMERFRGLIALNIRQAYEKACKV